MILGSTDLRKTFLLAVRLDKGEHVKEKASVQIRLERGLIFSLLLMITVFFTSQRIPLSKKKAYRLSALTTVAMDIVTQTNQGGLKRPPNLPQVPIPVEDEYLPEDETIEFTDLDVFEDIPLFDGDGTGGSSLVGVGRPRPIREVIPEYPKSERSRGFAGEVILDILVNAMGKVDSVRVVNNTTRSLRLAQAAVDAALRSQYMPAKRDGRPVPIWIQRPYRFEGK
jgi:TonB family protein